MILIILIAYFVSFYLLSTCKTYKIPYIISTIYLYGYYHYYQFNLPKYKNSLICFILNPFISIYELISHKIINL